MALNNQIVQQQLEATDEQVNFMYLRTNMMPLPVWTQVPGAGDGLEQDAPAPGGDDNEDGDGISV
jgi:hypothetical protein